MRRILRVSVLFLVAVGLTIGTLLSHQVGATVPGTNVALNYDSTNTNLVSFSGVSDELMHISEDGKVVAWLSYSRSIVPGDTGSDKALYIKNLQTGTTAIADLNLGGSHGWVADPRFAFSRTGRYVAFSSSDTNMVTSPSVPSSPVQAHVYLRDNQLGTLVLVDQTSSGTLGNVGYGSGKPFPVSVSDDGRFIGFFTQANNLLTADNPPNPSYGTYYIKDMQTGKIISPDVVSPGTRANSSALDMRASCDGSFMVFDSNATNRTPQDNGKYNTYLLDLRNGYSVTNLTYGANNGAKPVSISCNGRYIVLRSTSTNLTADSVSGTIEHWFRYDRLTGKYTIVDKSTSGYIPSTYSPSSVGSPIVGDNGLVVFSYWAKDIVSPAASKLGEIYLSNPDSGTVELVPVNASGVEQNSVFTSSGTLEIGSRGDFVIYESNATNLVPGVTSAGLNAVLSKIQ